LCYGQTRISDEEDLNQPRRQTEIVNGAHLGPSGRRSGGQKSPPVGSRGEAPVGGLGEEVPQKLKLFL